MKTMLNYLREKIKANPPGLYVLFYTEMWEMFGRFGIISLLVLYLTNSFHLSDATAFTIYSTFLALIYVTPIVCGFLSDRYLGLKHSVILGGCMMVVGNLLMVIPVPFTVYLGLAIVAVGSGFFLPSIVPMVGNLYHLHDRRRDAGFTLYYIGKNIGGLLAPILCGLVAVNYGYNYAFILSALGMISGVVIFIRGHHHLRLTAMQEVVDEQHHLPRVKNKFSGTLLTYGSALLLIPIAQFILVKDVASYLLLAAALTMLIVLSFLAIKKSTTERHHIISIVLMMLFVMAFGACLNQGGTTLNLFIERIVDREVLGFNLPPSFFYTLDPVFMILLGPFLAALWTFLAKKNREPSEPSKFALAMLLLGLGFGVFVIAAWMGIRTGSASPLFVVFAYFLFPLAELCIMPIGLSLVTKLAPKGLEAMLVGVWMLANAGASYFTSIISKLGEVNFTYLSLNGLKRASEIYARDFSVTALILFILAVILIAVVRPLLKRRLWKV